MKRAGPSKRKERTGHPRTGQPRAEHPRIVAETDTYVVIDKPALVDSQNSKPGRPSVVDWLREKFGYAGLIHRLDFGTSGLLVCAKTQDAAAELTRTLQKGKIGRAYVAVVLGAGTASQPSKMLSDAGSFSTPLEGQDAVTHFKVLERYLNAALVEVMLETGRKHQIRRHFSESGFPLLGDHLYGKKGAAMLFDRPALHAKKLTIDDGKTVREFEAPIPEDLAGLISRLKARRS